jgi:translation initiation factor IF-3
VRVIDEQGTQLGIMPLPEALRLAKERMADLVEVASQADPPVTRLLDYGKWKYEQSKREREARKNQKTGEVREVRLRPKIDPHDVDYRLRQAQEFLAGGDKVKISVLFRARELGHLQLGRKLLEHALEVLKDVAIVERQPLMEGRTMFIILAPGKQLLAARPRATQEPEAVAAEAS